MRPWCNHGNINGEPFLFSFHSAEMQLCYFPATCTSNSGITLTHRGDISQDGSTRPSPACGELHLTGEPGAVVLGPWGEE